MLVNIKTLIDDAQCYDTVRELRWPEGRQCPFCDSKRVIKRGFDEKELARQRYECKDCEKRFDDLTGPFLQVTINPSRFGSCAFILWD